MQRFFVGAILAIAMAAGFSAAQHDPAEKHVAEITAESSARYPQGMANSALCESAKKQNPPYKRYRWYTPNLTKMEPDLASLMRDSDEVVMVGTPLRMVIALSPSGEDAITYNDVRVLQRWKGFHKVGEIITFGLLQATVKCGPGQDEFSGTVVGPSPQFGYHTPNPGYSPDGPYLLFLKHPSEGSPIETFELAGGGAVQGFFDLVPAAIISEYGSPYGACYLASGDAEYCRSSRERFRGWSPDWCRDAKIDARNIAQCNAVVAGKQPIYAYGLEQDPLRKKYQGEMSSSFLREVNAVADGSAHAKPDQE